MGEPCLPLSQKTEMRDGALPASLGLVFPAGRWAPREARVPIRGHSEGPGLELRVPYALNKCSFTAQDGCTSCLQGARLVTGQHVPSPALAETSSGTSSGSPYSGSSSKEGNLPSSASEGLQEDSKARILELCWWRAHRQPEVRAPFQRGQTRAKKTREDAGGCMCQTSPCPALIRAHERGTDYPHFTDEKTEAHSTEATFPGYWAKGGRAGIGNLVA